MLNFLPIGGVMYFAARAMFSLISNVKQLEASERVKESETEEREK
jgi:hypothetical protein